MLPRVLTYLRPFITKPLRFLSFPKSTSVSNVSFDKDKFQAVLDLQQFDPSDINVEINESTITIEGRKEEKDKAQRLVSKHFVKKYILPKGYYDMKKLKSKLFADGFLIITAPRHETGDDECRKQVNVEKVKDKFKTWQ